MVAQVNRRGQIGPQGVLLMMAGLGHLLVPPSVVREAQEREKKRVERELLLAQGIDLAELDRQRLVAELGMPLPPARPLTRELSERAEREMFKATKGPPNHIEIYEPENWEKALGVPGLMKDGLAKLNAMAPAPGTSVYERAAVKHRSLSGKRDEPSASNGGSGEL